MSEPVLYAAALLALAAALLVLEVFVVSFGILLACSIASAATAIWFAFQAGPTVGWMFTALAIALAIGLTRWGLARLQRSSVVPRREIAAEAGYHHHTDRLGVKAGSIGTMVTPARPSGRARFPGGECDVQVASGPLETGASVIVERIEGPVVYVAACGASALHR